MMFARQSNGGRAILAVAVAFTLGACDDGGGLGGMFGGGGARQTEGVAQTLPRPDPDSRGVITYANSQVMVAREGDTIQAMAGRVGLPAEEIARYNGLPVTYTPREGEVLALPRDVGGTPARAPLWSTDIASQAIDRAPAGTQSTGTRTQTQPRAAGTQNPFNNGQSTTVIDPVRHRVEPGETAYSIARLYGVSVTALASWNGLDNNMTVRENQELLIPVANGANTSRSAAAAQSSQQVRANPPGSTTPIPAPPSAKTPLPENQDVAAVKPPPSPDLGKDRSAPAPAPTPAPAPAASSGDGVLALPVAGASVLRGYSPNGSSRNEGIDFAAPAGTPVTAAADGEVALISKSIGGLGTILLIRHEDNLMTVYGRITDVTLQKGDKVRRGQKVGTVAAADTPNLHFEVRRGTAAIDPTPYLDL